MQNISAFGLKATVVALQTFPMGFSLSEFADDVDALQIGDDEVAGYEMLYDGSLFSFTKASPIIVKVGIIPGSDDDINLKILLSARKIANKFLPIKDITSMVISYPNSGMLILSNGTILSGPPGDSVSPNGRKKSNTFTFAFGASNGAQSGLQIATGLAQGAIGLL